MKKRLENYVHRLFDGVPKTQKIRELEQEMLQNITEKFESLIAQGKSEEEAYNATVAGIGDISELLDELSKESAPVYTKQEIEKSRRRSAALVSCAVMLYIISIIPALILQNELGVALMFVIVAVATAIIIFNSMTAIRSVQEHTEQKKKKSRLNEAINSCIWSASVLIYLAISFFTMAWHITWLMFIFASAVTSVVDAVFDLLNSDK